MKNNDINKEDNKIQIEQYRSKVASEWQVIQDDINGLGVNDLYENFMQSPGEKQEKLIPMLLDHAQERNSDAVKERIYRIISCVKWLKGDLLTSTIDTLFEHFQNDHMNFNHYETDEMIEARRNVIDFEGAVTLDEISTIEVRWVIGLALNALISHKLIGHRKYQQKLQELIKNKKYRKGRSELVSIYAKLGKQEVVQDLIGLLHEKDMDVLGRTIEALGNLKAKEAKPYLEEILTHEDRYFRDLAKKALKKIG